MSRRGKQLVCAAVILLLLAVLIYALTADIQSLLLLTVATVLLHVAVCGSLVYFLYYNKAQKKTCTAGSDKK